MADGFQPKFVDLVRNTTTTVGTGNFNLGAAALGFTSFTAALQVGDSFYYSAIGVDKPAEREVGRGTLLAGGAISRDPIGGVKTNFTGGSKTIALIAAAEWYAQVGAGSSVASRAALGSSRGQGAMMLCETGREGLFAWNAANQAANVAADSTQGIYVPPASDPSGATGAWVRTYVGSVNVRWFGAAGDGTTDDGAAFLAAIAYLKTAATMGYGYGLAGSARLFVPKGVYWLNTATLEITHGMILEGESVGFIGPGSSVLKWAANTTGIRLEAFNTIGATQVLAANPSQPITGDAMVRNLTLYSAGGSSEGEFHAIQLRATGAIEDVGIYNFQGDGVHIVATAGGGVGSEGNANSFRLKRVFVQNCRNGFFIDGADANAGLVHQCSAVANRAWGFCDSSFLGNTYIACEADSNGLVPGSTPSVVASGGNRYCVVHGQDAGASANAPSGTSADNAWWYYLGPGDANPALNIVAWSNGAAYRSGGSYVTDDGNANNLLLGCYHEGGQGLAQLVGPTLVIGGTMRPCVKGVGVLYGGAGGIFSDGNITAQGAVAAAGSQHDLGPQTGAGDLILNLHSRGSICSIPFYIGGVPKGSVTSGAFGLFLDHPAGTWLRYGGSNIAATSGGGLDLQPGKVLSVSGTQVVGARQTGTPADATDLATALTLVNSLKSKLIAHGLIA